MDAVKPRDPALLIGLGLLGIVILLGLTGGIWSSLFRAAPGLMVVIAGR